MKKIYVTLTIALCAFAGINVAQAQIKVANGGNVGIGIGTATPTSKLQVSGNAIFTGGNVGIGTSNPSRALEVNGDMKFGNYGGFATSTERIIRSGNFAYPYANVPSLYSTNEYGGIIGTYSYPLMSVCANSFEGTLYVISDSKLKTNIVSLNSNKEKKTKLNQVKVYTYDYDVKGFDSVKIEGLRAEMIAHRKNQTGVMAQEIKDLYPELVRYDSLSDRYSVNYVGFVPHLIQAVQDLSKENETLKAQILSIQQNCCLASKPIATKSMQEANATEETIVLSARLDQNKPNPFKEGTSISYYIPEKAQKVGIYIYDLTGKQIKQIPIIGKGEGSISIKGSELTAGMYLYALIIDSMPIDTKRMILTE